jgi:DNA topoisomerase-1
MCLSYFSPFPYHINFIFITFYHKLQILFFKRNICFFKAYALQIGVMATQLMIVESPAKAKTIEKYLGKDFKVASSFGHVRDLPKTGMSIDIEHNFEPTYVISDGKEKTVSSLKKLKKAAETIWLATDGDREGEAIAWHLMQALNLDHKKARRIVFHEITKPAVEAAAKNWRQIDQNLVNAQQARRVLDRLVGYELSPVLWKKIRTGLSAGRVQSVAVRLVVEREREIENFTPRSTFKITAELETEKKESLKAELDSTLKDAEKAKAFLEQVKSASYAVQSLETKPGQKSPPPPFITSTLQQTAARTLGFSLKQTMRLAQNLYESGHITYMRTDSLTISAVAIKQISSYVNRHYGASYLKNRQYTTKSSLAQEAHEAIRPTDVANDKAGRESAEQKLYQLIWQRTVATQMSEARLERTKVTVQISKSNKQLIAMGEVLKFEGFLKVYKTTEQKENLLPALKENQPLNLKLMEAIQTFDKPKSRYSEGTLVKKLESLGIGRPSTYAPTISTIQSRGYVQKGDSDGEERPITVYRLQKQQISNESVQERYNAAKNKLLPTEIGKAVNDFLLKHFPTIVDYQFTAEVEAEFDNIAKGQKKWQQMIKNFYKPFHQTVVTSESVPREEATNTKKLGIDPKSKRPIYARIGRYGPMIQIGDKEDEEKPRFAPLPSGKSIDNITLQDALIMFDLPKTLGKTPDGEEIISNVGRFGPYVKAGNLFVSIKPDDPFSITLKRANELIKEKKQAAANRVIQDFKDSSIQILNGRFGPYITDGTQNASVPKTINPATIDLTQAQELLKTIGKPARRSKRKR